MRFLILLLFCISISYAIGEICGFGEKCVGGCCNPMMGFWKDMWKDVVDKTKEEVDRRYLEFLKKRTTRKPIYTDKPTYMKKPRLKKTFYSNPEDINQRMDTDENINFIENLILESQNTYDQE